MENKEQTENKNLNNSPKSNHFNNYIRCKWLKHTDCKTNIFKWGF